VIMTSLPAVEEYLAHLRRSMTDLPAGRRSEIVEEIRQHIEEMLAEAGQGASDADVRNILDRVGNPDEIAAEARERFGIKPATPRWTDTAAVPVTDRWPSASSDRMDRGSGAPVGLGRLDDPGQTDRDLCGTGRAPARVRPGPPAN
jgi:HAAS domain-containing protein